ncbi:MAG: helix-turn-helix transcriptional regulator [Candidatus Competibacteraceae bacterium]|nr:helix-turn-helix transcriptional regulator [Candidatus Competibacteraceae bacterium]
MRYDQWLRLRTAINFCYEGPVVGRSTIPFRVPYHSAWLVLEGWAEIETRSGKARANAGQWLVGGPGLRSQRFPDSVVLLSLAFLANWPTGNPLFPRGLPVAFTEQEHPRLLQWARRINRTIDGQLPAHDWFMHAREMPLFSFLKISRHLPDFLIELTQALEVCGVTPGVEAELDPRVTCALDLIESKPLDAPFSTAALADQSGISLAQLERLFSTQVGRSPKRQFDLRRLVFAEEALGAPEGRIKEVAHHLGFASLGHFTRWFRRFHRLSPRQYRQRRGLGGKA